VPRECLAARRRWACTVIVGLVLGVITACAGSSTAPGQARSAERAAQAFLEAVGSGRAGDALAFLRVQPLDRTLLTDDVLADAVRSAAITEVTATERGGAKHERMVDVAYRIGGERVTDTYMTVQVGQYWFVDETLPTVPLFDDRPGYADVTVSGKTVAMADQGSYVTEPSSTPILPGRYEFGLDNPLLDVDRAEFTVTSLHASAVLTGSGPQARLTDDGRVRVVTAAKEKLDACMETTMLHTSCGINDSTDWTLVRDSHGTRSYRLVDNTVVWSLDPGGTDLSATAPDWQTCRWFYPSPGRGVCTDGLVVLVHMTAATTAGTTEVNESQIVGYAADLADPDHIRIVFGKN